MRRLACRPLATLSITTLLAVGVLAGCGSHGGDTAADPDAATTTDAGSAADDPDNEADPDAADPDAGSAADPTVCAADATAIDAPYGEGFPTEWTFPPGTVVYNYEDRGADTGVIVTGVTTTPFDDVLAYLNKDEVANGFTFSDGETEEDDAESNWTSEDYTGRWSIKKSATCDGETVVQVLATQG